MDIKEMMRAMIMDSDKEPSVGIFWYLPEKHDLFEVYSKVPHLQREFTRFIDYIEMYGRKENTEP